MELDDKEILKLDLMTAINSMGTAQVLQTVCASIRGVSENRPKDWDQDLWRIAASLEALASKVADFEEHYGNREP